MFISVLICSDKRPGSLCRTLDSIFSPINLTMPGWEVIVIIDDASDNTGEVCRDFQARFPANFRFLVQKGKGKSNAMNLGIAAARGDILGMTDDDVICSPDYIRGIREVFSESSIDAAQGRVLLDCEGGFPRWMHNDLAQFMSLRDYGDQVREWHGNLTGTNMVVRTDVVRRVGGYTPELGAGAVGFAEDTEFSNRIRQSGCRMIYAPQVLVRHQLTRDRLSKAFFRERYFRMGRSNAYRAAMPVSLWRFGLYVAGQWILKELGAVWQRLRGHPADALRAQCAVREWAGFFWQHWQFRRGISRQLSTVAPLPSEGKQSPLDMSDRKAEEGF